MNDGPPTRPAVSPQPCQDSDPQLRQRATYQARQDSGTGPMAAGAPMSGPVGQCIPSRQADGPRQPRLPPGFVEATTPKLLVLSCPAVYAALALPLVLWIASVLVGVWHAEGLPEGVNKRDFEHPLFWFDRHVFRVWGPLLPLAPLALRTAALGPASARKPGPDGRPLRPAATLPLQALLVYAVVIVSRIALYLGHVELQRASAVALVSDHLLLAASVVACFQSELVMCLSDMVKVELLHSVSRFSGVKLTAVCTALVTSALLLVFVFGDMYCTARWYHEPFESVGALLAGALVFQAPLVSWVLWHAHKAPVVAVQ